MTTSQTDQYLNSNNVPQDFNIAGGDVIAGASGTAPVPGQQMIITAAGNMDWGQLQSIPNKNTQVLRQWSYWRPGNTAATTYITTGSALGVTTVGSGAAAASSDDSSGNYISFTSAATSGSGAGISTSGLFDVTQLQLGPRFFARIRTGPSTGDIQNCRIWVGLTNANCFTFDTPTTQSIVAFRYATGVDGTAFWRIVTCDGASNVTTTTTSVAIANDTSYTLGIDCSVSGQATFYINGVNVGTISTHLPTSTTNLGFNVSNAPNTTASKVFKTSFVLVSNL